MIRQPLGLGMHRNPATSVRPEATELWLSLKTGVRLGKSANSRRLLPLLWKRAPVEGGESSELAALSGPP